MSKYTDLLKNKNFSQSLNGFNKQEVNNFVDMMTLEFLKLEDENNRLSKAIKSYRDNNEAVALAKASIEKERLGILETAKKQAQQILNDADLKKARVLKDADVTLINAKKQADDIIQHAKREGHNTLLKVNNRVELLNKSISEISDNYESIKRVLVNTTHDFLSSVNEKLPSVEEIIAKNEVVQEDVVVSKPVVKEPKPVVKREDLVAKALVDIKNKSKEL